MTYFPSEWSSLCACARVFFWGRMEAIILSRLPKAHDICLSLCHTHTRTFFIAFIRSKMSIWLFSTSHNTFASHITLGCWSARNLNSFVVFSLCVLFAFFLVCSITLFRAIFICTHCFSNCFVRAYHMRSQLDSFLFCLCCQYIPKRWE